MTLISLKNLDVTIGKKQILKNIDLEVEKVQLLFLSDRVVLVKQPY